MSATYIARAALSAVIGGRVSIEASRVPVRVMAKPGVPVAALSVSNGAPFATGTNRTFAPGLRVSNRPAHHPCTNAPKSALQKCVPTRFDYIDANVPFGSKADEKRGDVAVLGRVGRKPRRATDATWGSPCIGLKEGHLEVATSRYRRCLALSRSFPPLLASSHRLGHLAAGS